MARQVTSQAGLLPPPLIIETDPPDRRIRIGAGTSPRPPVSEILGTEGAQGDAFDTQGRDATASLIACAQLFIEREGLTGTDPESLALAAADAPELREALLAMRDGC
jgi:hypothetical protein